MDIYADIYFVINFSMDFICLYITCLCTKSAVKPKRIAAASLIGGFFSVLSLFLPGSSLFSLLIALGVGLFMCFLCFSRRPFISFIIYMAVSFFMGGGLTFLYTWFNRALPPFDDGEPSPSSLLFPASLLCALASLFISRISNRFLNKKSAELYIRHANKEVTVSALVDSGNLLCDPISSMPVILIDKATSLLFLHEGDFSFDGAFMQRLELMHEFQNNIRVIPVKSMNGSSLLLAFVPNLVKVNGEEKRCLIAFSKATDFGGHSALLPSSQLPVSL